MTIEITSQTPTQYDLARWLFERISEMEQPKTQLDCLALMTEIMTAIRPQKEPKENS